MHGVYFRDLPACVMPHVTARLGPASQAQLGDIVYVELPEVGTEVKQNEQFGVVESVKVLLRSTLPAMVCVTCLSQHVLS